MTMRGLAIGATILLCGMAVGCSRSPRTTFYTLTAPAPSPGSAAPAAGTTVAIGPITLPEMVDRPQLVVREAQNRVSILEAQRWAEPLKTGIPRQLAQELKRQLGVEVAWYPQHATADAQYRVQLDVQRFEAFPGDAVIVETLWTVRRAGAAPKTGHSLVREPVQGAGYEAVAAAFSRALSRVGGDVAAGLRTLPPQTGPADAQPGHDTRPGSP